MRIIFMGTPEFAVASLRALLEAGFNVVGVITAPDKPAGRGQKVQSPVVKTYALENDIKVLQPANLKDPEFLNELAALQADLQVVVAFRMLPKSVWNMPPKGTINLHASLLPQYRGAAPINWAIINGESSTGVSTFFLKQEIDTGDILFTEEVLIKPDDTAGDLHDKLMTIGASLLVKTVKSIEKGSYTEKSQDSFDVSELKTAPKIFKEMCRVNWNQPTQIIYDHIRGLSPYPTAWTTLADKTLKIFRASKIVNSELDAPITPGSIQTDNRTFLYIACTDGIISLLEVQLEGKKRMGIQEFLRGVRI